MPEKEEVQSIMVNKVLIVILVLLVILNGAIGAYAYLLNKDIDTLSEQLTDQISAVRTEVTALSEETEARFDVIDEGVQSNQASIDALGDRLDEELAQTSDKIAGLEAGIGGIRSELAAIEPGLEADEVYQAVSPAVVEVSDGEQTVGSGFIFDTDGHVVTANHVVDELTTIHIILADGRTSPASVVGTCPLSDVAVLALERQFDIMPLTLADSSLIRIGEPAITVGSPFNQEGTVTAGIVSQVGRYEEIGDETDSHWVANLLQFDAPANFGNSGGPLFSAAGEVIGLIIARVGPDIGDGIAFAVSANKVRRVADAIIEYGSFNYPWIGVEVSDITPIIAETFGRETVYGAIVDSVTTGGPAEDAGVQDDDIIIAINGVAVTEVADLVSYLGEYGSPDDPVTLTIVRNDTEIELTVTLGTR
ncbi:MAG: trypsin-like peptidase domain-containing protein [Dehalococcoidales bacterium]|nr:MAG: trypsin-like peptidase domain-containing protein [Dehalococcoidales bacterium]